MRCRLLYPGGKERWLPPCASAPLPTRSHRFTLTFSQLGVSSLPEHTTSKPLACEIVFTFREKSHGYENTGLPGWIAACISGSEIGILHCRPLMF